MKKIIACLVLLAMVGIADAANVTNLFPNGDFESGGAGAWAEAPPDHCSVFDYPSSGGNPGGYGTITDGGGNCWGIWVGGDTTPLSLQSLGLTANQTYTFVMDMKVLSGTGMGGIKIESWRTNGVGTPIPISDSGNMRPLTGTSEWATYTFTYKIAANATGLKIVPLWGEGSSIAYDNIGVVIVGTNPVTVAISSPTNSQVVYSNFVVSANAAVNPGVITNVSFYLDNVLVGNATNSPFGYIATGVAAGAHALKAVAKDNAGNSATSTVVNVTVTNAVPPPINAYEPFDYGSLANGTPVTGVGFTGNWAAGGNPSIVSGLTYPNLPTTNAALQSSSGSQLATLSTYVPGASNVWVSFLFNQAGDNGGNRDGFVLEDSAGKGVMFAYQQFQATLGKPALVNVSSFTSVGSQLSPTSTADQTYGTVNFFVLRLTYNGGTLSSVAVYSNPTAGQPTAPPPDFTVSSGLSGIGLLKTVGLVHQGAMSLTVDEIRVGSSFADVAGGNLSPTVPTTLSLTVGTTKQLSWTATSTNYYQPQESSDNNNWFDLGSLLFGSSVTSYYDGTASDFYRVQEIASVPLEQVVDGGMEFDGGEGTAFYWTTAGQVGGRITNDFHSGTASMSLTVSNTASTGTVTDLRQNIQDVGGSGVTGGNNYFFSFWAKALPKSPTGGYVQQYRILWLNGSGGVVGSVGFAGFNAATDSWTQISAGPFAAPASAVNAQIEFHIVTGGFLNDFGGVQIDDVSLSSLSPGSVVNTLTPTIQNGQGFTATVIANGNPATDATGVVQFTTNSVNQSIGSVTNGSAFSAPANLPASYTVSATYFGNGTYIGSSATVVVGGGGVNSSRTNITTSISGNQLTLTWPADHTGWTLQSQTNAANGGLTSTWFDVAGSTATNRVTVTINPTNPRVFYRLTYNIP